jgi:hypothetical protein
MRAHDGEAKNEKEARVRGGAWRWSLYVAISITNSIIAFGYFPRIVSVKKRG